MLGWPGYSEIDTFIVKEGMGGIYSQVSFSCSLTNKDILFYPLIIKAV